jgi:transcription initiation factor TFIIIB Brf1 subunit/transcription initiation factor TFIIB
VQLQDNLLKVLYCPFCKTQRQTKKSDKQVLCDKCSCVLQQEKEYLECEQIKEIDTSTQSESKAFNLGLPTTSSNLGSDYTGKPTSSHLSTLLKRTALRANSCSTLEKNRFKGSLEIARICKALGVPEKMQSKIHQYYTEFSNSGKLRNRNIHSCALSLIVIVCNFNNVPLSISEALKQSGVSRKKFNKDYFYLYYLFEKAGPTSAEAEAHLKKCMSYVMDSWVRKAEFVKTLEKIVRVIDFHSLEGREAIVVAGSLCYHLLKYYGYPHIDKFLKSIVVNRLTLKNKWDILLVDHPFLTRFQ